MSRASLALLVALIALLGGAAWIRATPERAEANAIVCDEHCRPVRGVLGYETLVLEGATELRWRGPYGRTFRLGGDGRFPVHGVALWSGPTHLEVDRGDVTRVRFGVDHRPTWGEAFAAALAAWPWVAGLVFVALVGVILWEGGPIHAAALAFVLATVRAWSPAWTLDSDPARYWAGARAILEGKAPDTLWPPGWSAALVPAAWTGDVLWGRMTGVVLFALCPLLAARMARGGEGRAPIAAAILTAVSAELVGFAPSLYAEPLFVFLGLAMLGSAGPASLGLLGAAAALTRAHALLLVPMVALERVAGARSVAIFLICLVLPVATWSVVPSVHLGSPVLISDNAGMNLWIGHRPGADGDWHDPGPAPYPGYGAAALAAIEADPVAAAGRAIHNVERLWNASTSDRTLATRPLPLPLVPFIGVVLLAAIGLWRRPRAPLVLWLLGTTIATAIFFAPVRYKLGLFPGLLPLAGEGMAYVLARLAGAVRAWGPRRDRSGPC